MTQWLVDARKSSIFHKGVTYGGCQSSYVKHVVRRGFSEVKNVSADSSSLSPSAGHKPQLHLRATELVHQRPTSSKGQPLLYRQTVHQALELLVAQFDFILELALLDDERRLHLDKVLVVCKAVLRQAVAQDLINHAFPTVQVLLQLLCILVLSNQQLPLLNQCALY